MNPAILFPSSFPYGGLNSPGSVPHRVYLPPLLSVLTKRLWLLGSCSTQLFLIICNLYTSFQGELNKASGFLIWMSGRLLLTQKGFQQGWLIKAPVRWLSVIHGRWKASAPLLIPKPTNGNGARVKVQIPQQVLFGQEEIGYKENI